jgi:hypothetical protein
MVAGGARRGGSLPDQDERAVIPGRGAASGTGRRRPVGEWITARSRRADLERAEIAVASQPTDAGRTGCSLVSRDGPRDSVRSRSLLSRRPSVAAARTMDRGRKLGRTTRPSPAFKQGSDGAAGALVAWAASSRSEWGHLPGASRSSRARSSVVPGARVREGQRAPPTRRTTGPSCAGRSPGPRAGACRSSATRRPACRGPSGASPAVARDSGSPIPVPAAPARG